MSGIVGTSHSKSGVIGRSLDTAKAWCNFEGDGTPTFRQNFGFSSVVTGGSGGRYNLTFTTSFGHDVCIVGGAHENLDDYGDVSGLSPSNRNGGDGAGIKLTTWRTTSVAEGDLSDISIAVFD